MIDPKLLNLVFNFKKMSDNQRKKVSGNIFPYLKTNMATPLSEESLEKALAKVCKRIDATNERLDTIQANMIKQEDFKKIISNFNKKIEKMESDIDNVKKELTNVKSEMEKALKEVETLKRASKENSNSISVQNQNSPSTLRIAALEERLEIEENLKRRENLVFFGIPQAPKEKKEDIEKSLKVIIKERMEIDLDITSIIRMGHPRQGNPAGIKVQIPNEEMRTSILKNGKKLKGTKVFVSPDLSRRRREIIKILNIKRLEAMKDGSRAYLRGDKLYVDNKVFSVDPNNVICMVTNESPRHYTGFQKSTASR